MTMMPLFVSLAVLATVVLGLAIYRKVITRNEDGYFHADAVVNSNQEATARKLAVVDKWGKLLTVLAAVYSLVVLAVFLYNAWTTVKPIE